MYSSRISKPMLTQQQRNNRRKRATPDQLAFLRKSFMIDPKPDQNTREAIGRQIDMTPRSVQIWFQNNRAKSKHQEKKMKNMSHLPLKTSMCGENISRVHIDMSAMKPKPYYHHRQHVNRFYINHESSMSAPLLPNRSQEREAYRTSTGYTDDGYYDYLYSGEDQYSSPFYSPLSVPESVYDGYNSGDNSYSKDTMHLKSGAIDYADSEYDSMTFDLHDTRSRQNSVAIDSVSDDFEYGNFLWSNSHSERTSVPYYKKQHQSSHVKALPANNLYEESEDSSQLAENLIAPELDLEIDSLFNGSNLASEENVNPLALNSRKPHFSIF